MKTCPAVALAKVDHRLHRGKADSRGGEDSPPLWPGAGVGTIYWKTHCKGP